VHGPGVGVVLGWTQDAVSHHEHLDHDTIRDDNLRHGTLSDERR
jgi:hypothetical protein